MLTTTAEISRRHIKKAVRNLQKNDREWQVGFCDDCASLRFYPASFTDPGDVDCVAGLDPLDFHCYQKNMLWNDPKVIREAEEYASEDESEEVIHIGLYFDGMGGSAS